VSETANPALKHGANENLTDFPRLASSCRETWKDALGADFSPTRTVES